jgi:hypothetical protein
MPPIRSFGRFALGLLVAPLAGAAASMVMAYVFVLLAGTASERTMAGSWRLAIFVAFWTFCICLAYTIVVGSAAYAYVTLRRRRLSAIFAMIAGLVVGAPFIFIFLSRDSELLSGKSLFFPALAVICSLVTAWAFWAVALSSAVDGVAQDEPRLA